MGLKKKIRKAAKKAYKGGKRVYEVGQKAVEVADPFIKIISKWGSHSEESDNQRPLQ